MISSFSASIDDTSVCFAAVEVAARLPERMQGLLGRDGLAAGSAMLIVPCGSIHTFFMRFPIDVLFLAPLDGEPLQNNGIVLHGTSERMRVVAVRRNMKPWRMAWPLKPGITAVLETAAGATGTIDIRFVKFIMKGACIPVSAAKP